MKRSMQWRWAFGSFLETARDLSRPKMSQEDVAQRLNTTRSNIQKYERGRVVNVPDEVVADFCRIFDVNAKTVIDTIPKMEVFYDYFSDNPNKVDMKYVLEDSKLSPISDFDSSLFPSQQLCDESITQSGKAVYGVYMAQNIDRISQYYIVENVREDDIEAFDYKSTAYNPSHYIVEAARKHYVGYFDREDDGSISFVDTQSNERITSFKAVAKIVEQRTINEYVRRALIGATAERDVLLSIFHDRAINNI